jgi:hypothetical protein
MIFLKDKELLSLYKLAFVQLYTLGDNSSDPDTLKEDAACLELSDVTADNVFVTLENGEFIYKFPYKENFPNVEAHLIDEELHYWKQEFITSSRLDNLVNFLKEGDKRKGLLTLWEDTYRTTKVAPSTIYLHFRVKNGELEMHTHLRANNMSFLLVMDIQIMLCIQKYISVSLGLNPGKYIHFVDSLLFFKREESSISNQYSLFANSTP